jgi:hypothetical protein
MSSYPDFYPLKGLNSCRSSTWETSNSDPIAESEKLRELRELEKETIATWLDNDNLMGI